MFNISEDKKAEIQKRRKLKEAYEMWCSTGELIDDKETVKEMYRAFKSISELSSISPDYQLMAKDAYYNATKLQDIIIARYGKETDN